VAGLRTVSSVALAPDGRHVAYALAVPRQAGVEPDGAAWAELRVVTVDGTGSGVDRAFVAGEVNVSAVAWTASGEEIAFLAKRSGDRAASLYSIPLDGGEARRVLALASAIEAYDLAPDGKRVACIAAAPKDEAREKLRDQGFSQEVLEEDERASELWIAALDGSDPRRLPFAGHPRALRWSPTDERLLVAWSPTPSVDDGYMRQRLAVVEVADGAVSGRIENPGKLGPFEWSPDGRRVALISAADLHDPSAGRPCLAEPGSVPVDLLPGFEGDCVDLAWQSPTELLLVTHQGLWSRLERLELVSAPETRVLVGTGGPVLTEIDLSADGRAAAFVASSPTHPPEVFHLRHGEEGPRRLTDSNPDLAKLRFARQEAVTYEARDGLRLEGVLVHPLERAEGARVPLILTVHGGPESHVSCGWTTGYSNPGQMAAARGFAVFYPNYRGSTGRGVAFSKLGQGDAAGKEFDDLVDAVDHLVASGLVDGAKVGVTGGSYGGYATAWCATRFSARFAAGVMFVGIADTISKVGTTDIPEEEFLVHARARPWDDWMGQLQRSPIAHAGGSRTPLLILHGKDDPRVNPGQSRELFRHLKLRGSAPVRLVLYPGEGHGNRRAASRLDYSLRCLQWFEHYLLGPGGEMPSPELAYPPAEEGDG
jgi:dipeptidyl aminopeptidase/acylaminoacyl peptidase